MKLYAELATEKSGGTVNGFGYVTKDKPVVIDEFRMVMIEAKRGCKFGEVPIPEGMTLTLLVETEDKEE